MPKKNATQFWISTPLVKRLEERRQAEGRIDPTATYIENLLNQIVEGKGGNSTLEMQMLLAELRMIQTKLGDLALELARAKDEIRNLKRPGRQVPFVKGREFPHRGREAQGGQ